MRKVKDLTILREGDTAKKQRDRGFGELRDYSMKHQVSMHWDLNPEAIRDQIFELRIDDISVLLDSEQVQRLARWA